MAPLNGLLGWVDLTTSDPGAAKAFYSGLFGWTADDEAVPDLGGYVYSMMRRDGALVAGIGPQSPDMRAAGVPSTWTSYVLVDDADAAADAVGEAGGVVLMGPVDVLTVGRMAVATDPAGAVLGIWQSKEMTGAEVFNVPGALTWNELQSRDLAVALPFYEQVFGWRWAQVPDGSGYRVGHLDAKPGEDTSNCGAMPMPQGAPAGVPSYWAVYFRVDDVDAALARARELGGRVFVEPAPMGPGRGAGVVDPTGAKLFVISFPGG